MEHRGAGDRRGRAFAAAAAAAWILATAGRGTGAAPQAADVREAFETAGPAPRFVLLEKFGYPS